MTLETVLRARELVAGVPAGLVVADVVHQAEALEARRELRRPKGTGRHRLACPACHRFTTSTARPCSCGWHLGAYRH